MHRGQAYGLTTYIRPFTSFWGERVRWRQAYALTTRSGPLRPSLYGLITHMPASTSFCVCVCLWLHGDCSVFWVRCSVSTCGQRGKGKENPSGLGWGLVATTAGLEPVTSAVTGRRSNQLSYAAVVSILRLTTDKNITAKSSSCKLRRVMGVSRPSRSIIVINRKTLEDMENRLA